MLLKDIQFTTQMLIGGTSFSTIVLSHDKQFVVEMDPDFRFVVVSRKKFGTDVYDHQVVVPFHQVKRFQPAVIVQPASASVPAVVSAPITVAEPKVAAKAKPKAKAKKAPATPVLSPEVQG